MGRHFHTCKWFMPILLSVCSLNAAAATDSSPPITYKHLLPNAVQVQVTPRGMGYFNSRLGDILGNLGVKLDEGYFPASNYIAKNPINPDDYMNSNPEAVKMYKQVRELLTKWFVGFSLNNHQPAINIGESGYLAHFSHFGIVTDEPLMRALGKQDGAILAVELEVKKMTIATSAVTVWDAQNEFLGKAGFEDLTISMEDSDAENLPLKIRLPFYVRMNGNVLEFDALQLENNLDSIPLSLKYKKLIVPTFAIEVNGKKFFMNNAELDRFFTAQAPTILEKVRQNLGDFARIQLPEMLNKKAKQVLGGSLEQIQNMPPPGREPFDKRPDFKWGLQLQQINLNNSLKIDLTAYVEDPINVKSAPKASNAARGTTSFVLPEENYDIALSIDRALINRVLQLSFERRNFEKIHQKDGSYLKLTAAPTIDYAKAPKGLIENPGETLVKLHVQVENTPDSIFLKKTIILDFDIIAKLRQNRDKNGLQLILHSIDTESMQMDDKYISIAGSLVKGKVREGVKDKLREISAKWRTSEETLPGGLPLPPKILGIELDINRVVMDQTGHLVMYLDYANTGVN